MVNFAAASARVTTIAVSPSLCMVLFYFLTSKDCPHALQRKSDDGKISAGEDEDDERHKCYAGGSCYGLVLRRLACLFGDLLGFFQLSRLKKKLW